MKHLSWACGLALLACGPSPEPAGLGPAELRAADLKVCQRLIDNHIDRAATCKAAEAAINAEPSCQRAYQRALSLDCK